jgi:hypothetical protein
MPVQALKCPIFQPDISTLHEAILQIQLRNFTQEKVGLAMNKGQNGFTVYFPG